MPVVTLSEAKTLLGITVTTYDSIITLYIPIIQNQIVSLCRNNFASSTVEYTADSISFEDADPDTISDSESQFEDENFTAGIDILVNGSINNDGYYFVSTVAAGVITLDATYAALGSVIAEEAGEDVTINRVIFPDALKPIAAQMIWFSVKRAQAGGVKSESLGEYSYSLDIGAGSGGFGGYPAEIVGLLRPFMKVDYK